MAENSLEAISPAWLNQPVFKPLKYVKIMAIASALPVIFTMYGWIFNIEILKGFFPNQLPMKFISAVCFFFSALTVLFVAESVKGKREIAQIVLPATAISVLLLMSIAVAGSYLSVETGIESLFVGVQSRATNSALGDMPAVGEVISFIFIALIGILSLFRIRYLKNVAFFCGVFITICGFLALVGNLIDNDYLNFNFFSFDYPIVFSASIIFLILGLAICILGRVINKLPSYPYD